jgi:L-iditol 2-dehydrogenase
MKAALLTGIRELEIRDVPRPSIAHPEDVLLRVEAVGVCGSDLHYYKTGRIGGQVIRFPERVGHECAGTVVEAGPAVKGLEPGTRVAVDPLVNCGCCDQCLAGRPHTCRRQNFLGCPGQAPGAFAEYLVMPAHCCYPAPQGMGAAEAALAEPLSIGVYARRLAAAPRNAKIAILGSGPIGLCTLLAEPCTAYMTDLIDERLDLARRSGAVWTGNPDRIDAVAAIREREPLGVDFVFECAGRQRAIDDAVPLLKPGGSLVIVGIPEEDRLSFDIHNLRRKEIRILNVRRQNGCVAPALDLLSSNPEAFAPLVTHHFDLGETKQAFDLVAGYCDGVVKAMVHTA